MKVFLSISALLLAGLLSVRYGTTVTEFLSSHGVDRSTPSQTVRTKTDPKEEQKRLQEAQALKKQALAMTRRARYVEAEELLKSALSITSSELGSDHPLVATLFQDLATVYAVQGRYVEAEHLLRNALEINETILGPQHLDVAANLEALAFVLKREHQEEEAEQLAARASEIWDRHLGDAPLTEDRVQASH